MKSTVAFVATILTIASCAEGPTQTLAAIKTRHQVGKGCGSTSSAVMEIDGKPINAKKQLVVLSPGNHRIKFQYSKVVTSKTKALVAVEALNPVEVSGSFVAGTIYCVDPHDLVFSRVDISDTPLIDITGVGSIYELSGGVARITPVE